jgi:hypothetical protein
VTVLFHKAPSAKWNDAVSALWNVKREVGHARVGEANARKYP